MSIDNLIIIKGETYNDIEKTLRQKINSYFEDDIDTDFIFNLYQNGNNCIIQADKRLTNDDFFRFMNLLDYPWKIGDKVEITGYTTGKETNDLENEKLLVYILPNDMDFSVSIVTERNRSYRYDFDGRIAEVKVNRPYTYPENIDFGKPKVLRINKILQSKENKSKQNTAKRFWVILTIASGLFVGCLSIRTYDTQLFENCLLLLGYAFGLWFLADYKVLRINKYYFLVLMISIVYLRAGLVLIKNMSAEVMALGLSYPLAVLLVQKLLRALYVLLLKKEPRMVNRGEAGTLADRIYTLILLLIPLPLSFWVMELFNQL